MVQGENNREGFSRRLRLAAKVRRFPEFGLAAALARATGVTPKAAGKWLHGESTPSPDKMRVLADFLVCNLEWLAFGDSLSPDVISKSPPQINQPNTVPALRPVRSYRYPEISWAQAGEAREAVDLFQAGDCKEMHTSDEWAGDNGFWLQVRGPSMASSTGPSFPEGMLILVAPGITPENGQFVVAKRIDGAEHEPTFKQLYREAGIAYLRPLNPDFQTIVMNDEWAIVGTVIDAKLPKGVFRR